MYIPETLKMLVVLLSLNPWTPLVGMPSQQECNPTTTTQTCLMPQENNDLSSQLMSCKQTQKYKRLEPVHQKLLN